MSYSICTKNCEEHNWQEQETHTSTTLSASEISIAETLWIKEVNLVGADS